jgi:hypothetical protein
LPRPRNERQAGCAVAPQLGKVLRQSARSYVPPDRRQRAAHSPVPEPRVSVEIPEGIAKAKEAGVYKGRKPTIEFEDGGAQGIGARTNRHRPPIEYRQGVRLSRDGAIGRARLIE